MEHSEMLHIKKAVNMSKVGFYTLTLQELGYCWWVTCYAPEHVVLEIAARDMDPETLDIVMDAIEADYLQCLFNKLNEEFETNEIQE